MDMASHKAVLGLVSNSAEAEGVIATLQQSGFAAGDVSVLFPDMRGTDIVTVNEEPVPSTSALPLGTRAPSRPVRALHRPAPQRRPRAAEPTAGGAGGSYRSSGSVMGSS